MRRKIYNKLVEWKLNSNGKTALLIEGSRRVGKSSKKCKRHFNSFRREQVKDVSNGF